jgi:hypothetical protein
VGPDLIALTLSGLSMSPDGLVDLLLSEAERLSPADNVLTLRLRELTILECFGQVFTQLLPIAMKLIHEG